MDIHKRKMEKHSSSGINFTSESILDILSWSHMNLLFANPDWKHMVIQDSDYF